MKKTFILLFVSIVSNILFSQNVGIGTTTPAARLHVADSSVLFGGPLWFLPNPPVNSPVSPSGTRMLWYSDKAAFRAGAVSNNVFDNKDSIGKYSFAAGIDVKAKGDWSVAMGLNGNSLNWYGFTAGAENTAAGVAGIAMGYYNVSRNSFSVSIGNNLITKSVDAFSTGSFNDTSDVQMPMGSIGNSDRIFQVGNGSVFTRSNAITILRNGNTGIGVNNPAARLHVADSNVLFTGPATISSSTPFSPAVQGAGTRMMWYPQKAAFRAGTAFGTEWDKDNIGINSFAAGNIVTASGNYSTAIGNQSTASGNNSTAIGNGASASGNNSTALGTFLSASGNNSTAMGVNTSASGYISTAMGFGTRAKALNSTTIGQFNDEADNPNPNIPAASDRIFQIGNGDGGTFIRSNALTVLRNGNMGIGNLNPAKPLSFPASLGEKILLYPGGAGEVGIGVYGNELRLHCDNPGSMVSFGTQDNAGNFTQAGRFQISAPYALYVNGSIWANGTTYASDERFKENISAIQSPLQKLMQINGVEYEMKAEAFAKQHFMPGRQIGLLAQNVEKIIPDAVHEKDGYKGVDYAKLVPLLIEALKEQQKQIDELKRMIETFQRR